MKHTPRRILSLLAITTVLLLLLSIESSAAYRFKKSQLVEHTLIRPGRDFFHWKNNLQTVFGPMLPNRHHLYSIANDQRDTHKSTASKFAIIFGAAAVLSFLVGIGILFSPASSDMVLALFSYFLLAMLFPVVFGGIAIGTGLRGIKKKKHKELAIAGLVLGGLGIVLVATLLAYSLGAFGAGA